LNTTNVFQHNNVITLKTNNDVKTFLEDYQGALKDLNKTNIFKSHDTFTMQMQGDAKKMLKDYQGALNDLNALQFKYVITLQR
jgi:hypothetical protein